MKSIKAILAGCVFIVVVILVMQLVFIFIAVGYNELAKSYPSLNEISGIFRYLIGVPVFVAVMFVGGYITATVAGESAGKKGGDYISIKVWPYCVAVGMITAGGMLFSALQNSSLTMTGIIVFILAISATTAGGQYWQKQQRKDHMI